MTGHVGPLYANTHTETSATGRQTSYLREEVRQLQHHFCPFFARFSAPTYPARAVYSALLGTHAHLGLIGAWNPML